MGRERSNDWKARAVLDYLAAQGSGDDGKIVRVEEHMDSLRFKQIVLDD